MIKNAADPSQVKRAADRERYNRETQLNDIRIVLGTLEGRRLMWRLMGHAKVFESIWEPSAKIHYNSGLQDFGHFIMSEIADADQALLFKMMLEAKQEEEKQND